ncbi:hypothetical protein CBS101457_002995 [Exobasidium rhododendri]|nr:hypothetical protein CBS101457_002995 [Exobasidium rhododendri]
MRLTLHDARKGSDDSVEKETEGMGFDGAARPTSPLVSASLFSRLTFHWVNRFMLLGFKKTIQLSDVPRLPEYESARHLLSRFHDIRARSSNDIPHKEEVRQKRSLFSTLAVQHRAKMVVCIFLSVVNDVAVVSSSLVLSQIIKVLQEEQPDVGKGIGFAVVLSVVLVVSTFTTHTVYWESMRAGARSRAVLIAALFERSLSKENPAGQWNFMSRISTDATQVDVSIGYVTIGISSIIQVILSIALLLVQMGVSSLAGIAVIAPTILLQIIFTRKVFRLRQEAMKFTDQRSTRIRELLFNIATVKSLSLEEHIQAQIAGIRDKEMRAIWKIIAFRAVNESLSFSLPIIGAVVAFIVYIKTGNSLDPAVIFPSLTLFRILGLPLQLSTVALGTISDAASAFRRLEPIFENDKDASNQDTDSDGKDEKDVYGDSICFDHCDLGLWLDKEGEVEAEANEEKKDRQIFTPLRNINLRVDPGQLCVLTGAVGSGKSSLLHAALGQLDLLRGSLTKLNRVSFCPQEAWILNSTFRENILFGMPYDQDRYTEVLEICQLQDDVARLDKGDMTELGEMGSNLSIGQRQRVSIARAIYYDAPVMLFDDVLAGLDAKVARSVFEAAILPLSRERRTVILVSHAASVMEHADFLVRMEAGSITSVPPVLKESHGSRPDYTREETNVGEKDSPSDDDNEDSDSDSDAHTASKDSDDTQEKGLMQEEERKQGKIGFSTMKAYVYSGRGAVFLPLGLLFLALTQASIVLSSYWLVFWEEDEFQQSTTFYMAVLAGIAVSISVFSTFYRLCFGSMSYFASRWLHYATLRRLLQTPMSWFDTVPIGRIENRMIKDFDVLDNRLIFNLQIGLTAATNILGPCILICVLAPYFVVCLAAGLAFSYGSSLFYRRTSRELQRVDALLRSKLYAHFSQCLQGQMTLQAYNRCGAALLDHLALLDDQNDAYIMMIAAQRWLGLRLGLFGNLLSFIVAIVVVVNRGKLTPSQAGVALSSIVSATQALSLLARQFAEVENDFNSTERILHYANTLEQEDLVCLDGFKEEAQLSVDAQQCWPVHGCIELRQIKVRYREDLDMALDGITLTIGAGERLAVVGRTGSGKTTLQKLILRLIEPCSGTITIDGVNTSHVGLKHLRQSLGVLSQEPLLFQGTVRENLSPDGDINDADLYSALQTVTLAPSSNANGRRGSVSLTLESVIDAGAANLSYGQRALLCLARVIIKKPKIVLMDEPTASVDPETDEIIQAAITKSLHGCTLITIAHRLKTVLHYDRVAVFSDGQLTQIGTPLALYNDKGTPDAVSFRGMCRQAGLKRADLLQGETQNRQ